MDEQLFAEIGQDMSDRAPTEALQVDTYGLFVLASVYATYTVSGQKNIGGTTSMLTSFVSTIFIPMPHDSSTVAVSVIVSYFTQTQVYVQASSKAI